MLCARQVLRLPDRHPILLTLVARLQHARSRVLRWCRLHLWCDHRRRAPRHHGVQCRLGHLHGGVCYCGALCPDPLSEPQLFVSVGPFPIAPDSSLPVCIYASLLVRAMRACCPEVRDTVFSKFCTMSTHYGVYPSWSKCKLVRAENAESGVCERPCQPLSCTLTACYNNHSSARKKVRECTQQSTG